MTTDDTHTSLIATTTGTSAGCELAEQYWTTMARTADLVRKLTALADRYDAAIQPDDARAADRRQKVALMRATAESGRRLIRSVAPPAPRAAERDVRVRGAAGDDDLSWADRFLAACDRDPAAGDRPEALDDRGAAREDVDRAAPTRAVSPDGPDSQARTYALVTRLEERAVVRQAQGVLMQRAGMTAGEAFEALLLAANGPLTLDAVADHVVRRAELPGVQDRL